MTQDRQADHAIESIFTRRWSPRSFTGEALPESVLLSFFEAARWAPSSNNAQPWRFIYAFPGGPGWDLIFESLGVNNRAWAQRASALILVLSKTQWIPPGKTELEPIKTHSFDTGAAWANFALQVTHAGWHAHGIGGFDRIQARSALSIPADFAIEAVIAVGRQGDKAALPEALQAREAPNGRLPVSQLVSNGKFQFPV